MVYDARCSCFRHVEALKGQIVESQILCNGVRFNESRQSSTLSGSMQLILATRNPHKTREVQRMLGPEFTVRDLGAFPHIPEISETGNSFEENAIVKAISVSSRLPGFVIADDSGLEVDALGGAPGIYSARYAGTETNDEANNRKLLKELENAGAKSNRRSARFRCVIALAREGNVIQTFHGAVEGTIVNAPRGDRGFGYDPLFLPDGFIQTFGELPDETKDRVSHRARALRKLAVALSTQPVS
jgi:XTP/dITP diphosphohydrolase